VNVPATRERYDALFVGSDVDVELTIRRGQIYSSTFYSRCLAVSNETRFNNSLAWFDLMTRYLAVLRTIRAELSSETISRLNHVVDETHGQVTSSRYVVSCARCSMFQ